MRHLTLPAAFVLATALPTLAETPNPIQRNNFNTIWFENWIGLSNAMLRVATPDGVITTEYETSHSPVYSLSGSRIADGVYRYELRAATDEHIPSRDGAAQGSEDDGDGTVAKPFYRTGAFLVKNGVIVTPDGREEEREAD